MSDSRTTQFFEALWPLVDDFKEFYDECLYDILPSDLTAEIVDFRTAYSLAVLALGHAPRARGSA